MPLPLLYTALALLTGILLAAGLRLADWSSLAIAAGFILIAAGLGRRFRFRWLAWLTRSLEINGYRPGVMPLVLILVGLLGAGRYAALQPDTGPGSLIYYHNQGVYHLEGVLIRPPDIQDRSTRLWIAIDRLQDLNMDQTLAVQGQAVVQVQGQIDLRYGDRLGLVGQLQDPPENGDFSYRDYLARQQVYTYIPFASIEVIAHDQGSPIWAVLHQVRAAALLSAARIFPQPEAALLSGIVLGDDSALPHSTRQAFQRTGTAHIIAISGYNIAILAQLLAGLLIPPLGRKWGSLATLLGLVLYAGLVGGTPSVIRATIMGVMGVVGRQIGQRQQGLNSLGGAALLMCLIDPYQPWDAGFQLSFFATLGLILYATPLEQRFRVWVERLPFAWARPWIRPINEYLLLTLAAQITTVPIMAVTFGHLSLIAPLINALILPVQPLVMLVGAAAIVLGLVSLPLGLLAAGLAWPFTAYTIRMVELGGQIPAADLAVTPTSPWLIAIYYVALLALTFSPAVRARLRPALQPGAILTVLAALTLLVWQLAWHQPDGQLHLILLPTETGDTILVQTPGGETILIGGGMSTRQLATEISRRQPWLDRHIDLLVLPETQQDHLSAWPAGLDYLPVRQVVWLEDADRSSASRALSAALAVDSVPVIYPVDGQELDLGSGASLQFQLNGENGGDLWIHWGNFSALLPFADGEPPTFHGAANVVLLRNHGSADANPLAWLDSLQPQLLLANPGPGQWDAAMDTTLGDRPVLRTDQHGWIAIHTDGRQMWVEAER